MSRTEYAFLPYIIFDQRTTTTEKANKMTTLSEITTAYKNASTEERKEYINLIMNDPYLEQQLNAHVLGKLRNGGML